MEKVALHELCKHEWFRPQMPENLFLLLGGGCVTPGTDWAGAGLDMGKGGGSSEGLGRPPWPGRDTIHTQWNGGQDASFQHIISS